MGPECDQGDFSPPEEHQQLLHEHKLHPHSGHERKSHQLNTSHQRPPSHHVPEQHGPASATVLCFGYEHGGHHLLVFRDSGCLHVCCSGCLPPDGFQHTRSCQQVHSHSGHCALLEWAERQREYLELRPQQDEAGPHCQRHQPQLGHRELQYRTGCGGKSPPCRRRLSFGHPGVILCLRPVWPNAVVL